MLQSYQAELHGARIIWIDHPPPTKNERRLVTVVMDDTPAFAALPATDRLENFAKAQGCMGRASRAQVLLDLESLRLDWERGPTGAHRTS